MRIPEKPPANKRAKVPADYVTDPRLQEVVRQANEAYLHWDKFRFHPMPDGVDAQSAWAVVQSGRAGQFHTLPLTYYDEKLHYWIPPKQHEWLNTIDTKASGYLVTRDARPLPDDNDRYLYNSLMEEAIASSILEGAVTTRDIAKEMLRTKRAPRDKAECMVVNNYNAILEIRDLKKEKLTPAVLRHLQQVLTKGTLDDPAHAGSFRTSKDRVHVVDRFGDVVFTPPPAASLAGRIDEVCAFANQESKPFVHPVIKAMALHFALGFIHPFCDGNGRTARAIFYWYMLKSRYGLFEYLPISRIILAAPIKYARAYLYTETDHGDLTYFHHYHLSVISRAISDLHQYLNVQQQELTHAQQLVQRYPDLNVRQRTMISHALRHPTHRYTIKEHEGEYRITYNTARADLYGLEKLGLVVRSKGTRGKEQVFRPVRELAKELAKKPEWQRAKRKP